MFKRNSIRQLGGGYGLGFHWTTWNVTQEGINIPFEEQVNNFDVDKFVRSAKNLGAKHVLITNCHALQYTPAPNPYIDALISNRTCKRDVIGELAEALRKEDMKFICYYHHGCDGPQDPDWWNVCGGADYFSDIFYKNIINIISYIGERYGDKIDAFWFDAGYGYWRRGYVPWKELSEAARAGNPDRLITYNPGVKNYGSYTEYQDYYAGEVNYRCLECVPKEETVNGMDWYSFMALHKWTENPDSMDCAQWGIDNTCWNKKDWDKADPKDLAEYVKKFNAIGSTVTFNMLCYADGSILQDDADTINEMRKFL